VIAAVFVTLALLCAQRLARWLLDRRRMAARGG
jgi:hypothetical protein